MKKFSNIFLFLLVFSIFPNGAVAEPTSPFYIKGLNLFNVDSKADASDVEFAENNGWSIIGGYRLNSLLSLELGAVQYEPSVGIESDSMVMQRTEFDAQGFTLALQARTNYVELFDVWAAVGVFDWDADFRYDIRFSQFPGVVSTGFSSASGQDLFINLGAAFPIIKDIDLVLEVGGSELTDFLDSGGGETIDIRQRYIGFGLEYRF